MPADVSYAEAAALADATALCFLRDKARLGPGQTILVNGASGAVGSSAVQLARHFGATVTGVCSGANTALVRELGAESVVDYTRAGFTRTGRAYDVIFDVAGTSSFARCRRALTPAGVYLTTAPSAAILLQTPWTARFGPRKAVVAFTGLRPAGRRQAQGPAVHQGARRGGCARPGHRRVLPAEPDRRRVPARRRGAQTGQRRRHDGGLGRPGEPGLHGLCQGERRAERADHDRELLDQAAVASVEQVAALELAVAHPGAEDQHVVGPVR
jgi:Zinc-binding dehydrogenase